MPRDRSRSPRRKERRRSRSREKKLDKFGRDVSSRPSDRYGGSSRSFREEPSATSSSSSSRRREEPVKDFRNEERNGDNRYQQSAHSPPPPPPPPSQNQYNNGSGAGGYPSNQKASGAGYEYDYRGAGNQEAYYGDQAGGDGLPPKKEVVADVVDEETRKMQQLMGIGGFETTKNKKVSDNVGGFAKINKTQRYRQYMNRRGGFNRPLDWVG